MPTLLNKTLRLFLESIGRRDEYEFYLEKFTKDPTPAFALICPERSGFEEMVPVFRFDLNALLKLQLHPAILLAGPTAEEMSALLQDGNHPYVAGQFTPGDDVIPFLNQAREASRLGVLVMPGVQEENALNSLVPAVTRRIHFIRVRGQLRGASGDILNYYFVNRPNPALDPEDETVARFASRFYGTHPDTHISVCSPWNLLQELFTVRGAGSVIRKASDIERFTDMTAVNIDGLMTLLEHSFQRRPKRDLIMASATEVYLELSMRAAAVIEPHAAGSYLSKFAVGTEARGEGLAGDLWQRMRGDHPHMFWRARNDNPVNQWYDKRADGHHAQDPWRVYWSGVAAPHLPAIIDFCVNRPEDFFPGD